jgi:two-component system, cell cycle response regulator
MKRVLIFDNDRETVDLVSKYLSKEGYIIQSAGDADAAIHRLKAWKPHLVLLGLESSNLLGLELIPKIRALTTEDYTSILVLSPEMELDQVVQVLNAGADEYLSKPFRVQDLVSRVRSILKLKEVHDALKRANHRIEELSSTDDLTGLMNMRSIFRKGEEEIVRSRRYQRPVSLLLLNLDGFSAVNQTYGFMAGSQILQEVAGRIKQCVRSVDMVARVGADEFFVLLLETDLNGAEFIAERIRDSIQANQFKNEKQSIKLTASLGVAGLTPDQTNLRMGDLLHLASEALRLSKANGTNRTEVFSFA